MTTRTMKESRKHLHQAQDSDVKELFRKQNYLAESRSSLILSDIQVPSGGLKITPPNRHLNASPELPSLKERASMSSHKHLYELSKELADDEFIEDQVKERAIEEYEIAGKKAKRTECTRSNRPTHLSHEPNRRSMIEYMKQRATEGANQGLSKWNKDKEIINEVKEKILLDMSENIRDLEMKSNKMFVERKQETKPKNGWKGLKEEMEEVQYETANRLRKVEKQEKDLEDIEKVRQNSRKETAAYHPTESIKIHNEPIAKKQQERHEKPEVIEGRMKQNQDEDQTVIPVKPREMDPNTIVRKNTREICAEVNKASEQIPLNNNTYEETTEEMRCITSQQVGGAFVEMNNHIEPQLMSFYPESGTIDESITITCSIVNSKGFWKASSVFHSVVIVLYLVYIIFINVNVYIDEERRYLAKMRRSGLVMKCFYYVMRLLRAPIF